MFRVFKRVANRSFVIDAMSGFNVGIAGLVDTMVILRSAGIHF